MNEDQELSIDEDAEVAMAMGNAVGAALAAGWGPQDIAGFAGGLAVLALLAMDVMPD